MLRRTIIILVALPIIIIGVILIPLPGPGVLICLLGFFILSLEFDWARQHLDSAKQQIKVLYNKAKARGDRIASRVE